MLFRSVPDDVAEEGPDADREDVRDPVYIFSDWLSCRNRRAWPFSVTELTSIPLPVLFFLTRSREKQDVSFKNLRVMAASPRMLLLSSLSSRENP